MNTFNRGSSHKPPQPAQPTKLNMLNDLLLLGFTEQTLPKSLAYYYPHASTHTATFPNIKSLVEYLLSSPNYSLVRNSQAPAEIERVNTSLIEKELDYSVSIIINSNPEYYAQKISDSSNTSLSSLSLKNLLSLLNYRFLHLNPIILSLSSSDENGDEISHVSSKLNIVRNNLSTRLARIKCWIGFNDKQFDQLDTMIHYLNLDLPVDSDMVLFTKLLSTDIDYDKLLKNLESHHDDEYYLNLFNKWDFNAFHFNLDELLKMSHILLNSYSINAPSHSQTLNSFLFFVRDNYRIGNPFHNFRHAIDVLQATNFILNILTRDSNFKLSKSDSFSLLLASLGHDIGHPGITNAFLINTKSPLATYFDNHSILENFHRLQFKKILIPFLNQSKDVFPVDGDTHLKHTLSIVDNAILATDMAKHDDYVKEIHNLESDFDNFELLSCILIKCADISNVCRPLNPSCKWGLSLGEEFKQIGCLESYFKSLTPSPDLLKDDLIANNFGKPIKDIDVHEGITLVDNLSKNQLFFINRFANDFFTKVANTIPQLHFFADHLIENAAFWESVC